MTDLIGANCASYHNLTHCTITTCYMLESLPFELHSSLKNLIALWELIKGGVNFIQHTSACEINLRAEEIKEIHFIKYTA